MPPKSQPVLPKWTLEDLISLKGNILFPSPWGSANMAAGAQGKARAVLTARPAMSDLHLHGWLHAEKNTRDFRWCSPDAAAKEKMGLLKAYCEQGRASSKLAGIGEAVGLCLPGLEDLLTFRDYQIFIFFHQDLPLKLHPLPVYYSC